MTNYEKYSKKILSNMKKRKSFQNIYWTFVIDDCVEEDTPQPMFFGTRWDAFAKFAKHYPTDWMYFVETAVDTLGNVNTDELVDSIDDWSSDSNSCIKIIQLQIME